MTRPDDDRTVAEMRADHLAEFPDGCKAGCLWCVERARPKSVPSLFDGGDAA